MFDTVDHDILLRRLHQHFGVEGAALTWIDSFLKDRTQQVQFNGSLSESIRLTCGVPQGSVLGPLLYLLYTSELFAVIEEHGLTAHSYADDTQAYLSLPATDAQSAADRFVACFDDISQV